ncbi:major facilitator superfamily domain-containing protein [Suillus clintonianus]|uniref:major facilitator superfamily domain-containing protein n=1 Tax=Suillus clintonianus TaxID=1904413 RepID=UPI001B884887|nr:major facilitator superfamily domain-containing protein [Suillus clintonianus]KAG2125510.1 major facilitator superfamily domain-containing protein [Suillus clintonianus]
MHDIDDSVVPGSVYLVDVQAKTTVVHAENDSAIVLSPTPSNDINDPLNWSRGRKLLQIVCVMIYTSAIGIGTTVLYSILQPISNDTGIPLATLNAGTGYMFLFLGWGALINQPLALTFGKRGIYLISVLGNTAMCLLTPYIKTEGQWIASKIVQGYLCTPVESLCEVSIADVFFAHERGTYIGIYTLFLFGSNYFAPLIAGFIYDGQGWHWVMYWAAIINFGSLIVLFFFMEETNFVRNTSEATEAVHLSTKPDAEKDDKESTISSPVSSGDLTGIPKTYAQRLALFGGRYASNKLLFTMTYRPIILLRFPVIFWAGFQYGTCLVWYNVLNATCSLILSEAPYNFRASFVGLTYLGPLIGMLLGTFYSGWVGDRFAVRYARRTHGIREPEHRLWLMVVSLLLCPASLILWGVGASKGINWVGLVFGMGIISCSTGIGSSLSIGYALDSYKDLGGEVMMAVILVRNTLSFAIGYGITPWLHMGYQNTFISAGFVGLAITMTFLIVIKWGKSWRIASRKRYWGYVADGTLGH